MKNKHDFYTGFEGEPEYIFLIDSAPTRRLRIWSGYVDSILMALEAKKPEWVSIFKFYQLEEGWFDESPWVVPDVQIAFEQLTLLHSSELEGAVQSVYLALCTLFQEAIQTNRNVMIFYD